MAELSRLERAALIGQVVALRNVVDGILASLQEEQDREQIPPAPACEHPLEARDYKGETMGSTRFTCQQCGATVAAAELDPSRLVRPNKE